MLPANRQTSNFPQGINKAVLYCIVLYCIVLYCIVLYCIVWNKLTPVRSIHILFLSFFLCFFFPCVGSDNLLEFLYYYWKVSDPMFKINWWQRVKVKQNQLMLRHVTQSRAVLTNNYVDCSFATASETTEVEGKGRRVTLQTLTPKTRTLPAT